MAWPPPVLPVNRTDATPQQGTHPGDHNALAQAINDVAAELGADPSGSFASLTARLNFTAQSEMNVAYANLGNPAAAGIYNVVPALVGQTRPVNMNVIAVCVLNFGFAVTDVAASGDIWPFASGTPGGVSGNVVAIANWWEQLVMITGWTVLAGGNLGWWGRVNLQSGAGGHVNGTALTFLSPF